MTGRLNCCRLGVLRAAASVALLLVTTPVGADTGGSLEVGLAAGSGASARTKGEGPGPESLTLAPYQWTWASGSDQIAESARYGVYGTLGTPSPGNVPGARSYSVSWTGASGGLWLFGGQGYAASGTADPLNDFWKYDPSTGHWTWMGGSTTTKQSGTYGTLGTPAPGNVPGARHHSARWTDASGNLWLFGGGGYVASASGYLNDLWKFDPSTGYWTWMGGANGRNQLGTYGTLGTAAPGNVPGARYASVTWTDAGGNLWLFGGRGYDSNGLYGSLNDLWKYDPSTGYWTWMGGSNGTNQSGTYGTLGTAAPGNVPGARYESVSWTDASGNLWLFGGAGSGPAGGGVLNDLWKYEPSTGYWTWMGGSNGPYQAGTYGTLGTPAPGNVPGARYRSVSWTDASGSLWLFGGYGNAASGVSGYLNDLWKYDTSTGYWTWMGGSNGRNQVGTYGTLGTPAPGNVPGARDSSVSWVDASGNLWLFAGYGYSSGSGYLWYLKDLWKHDPSTGNWVWMGGLASPDRYGRYGTLGTSAAGNIPGARNSSASWADPNGELWLFGGAGYSAGGYGRLNDLWKYDPSTGYWTWMGGSNGTDQNGTYGTLGTPAPGNVPGARVSSVCWTDASGNLWLFGGYGNAASGIGYLNDLWKYDPSTGYWTWIGGSSGTDQIGTYGTLGAAASGNKPGARERSVCWTDASGAFLLFGGNGYAASGLGSLNDLWKYDPSTGYWTWMGGSNATSQVGTYGTLGIPAPGNVPGARRGSVSWTDGSGKLWLFGGEVATSYGWLNDLWRYDPSTSNWTWMGGSSETGAAGTYGTLGIPAPGNVPGARFKSVSWTDAIGTLWLFGGFGGAFPYGDLNDLWKYDPSTGYWTWMGGSNGTNQSGTYGTLGTAAPGNVPGARAYSVSWTDAGGNLWLFGGRGYDSNGLYGSLNDLWVHGLGTLATGFYILNPCRLFDTRESSGAAAAAPSLAPGETRILAIGARCGVSTSTVRSLAVNLTVTAPEADGEIVLARGDLPATPTSSSISYRQGRTRANNGILELSWVGDGTIKVHNRSAGSVHFILDVNGFFQ